ncbi:MAG: hypothetical protein RL364_394, partial [Pseudomonadota bacterium]
MVSIGRRYFESILFFVFCLGHYACGRMVTRLHGGRFADAARR